jgi:hypothetical protein
VALLIQIVGWTLAVFVGALCLLVIVFIATGRINIERLISEPSGEASLSRFQFLIFHIRDRDERLPGYYPARSSKVS